MMLIVVKLLKLDIENFRGIKNFVLTPDGRSVTVQGANGTGKSTLMAAFLWLLTGKDAQGRENYNVFPLGTDGNRLSGCSPTVTATLSMPDGRTLILQRSICERWTKRRGSAETEYNGDETRYFIDEVPVSAGEYSSAIFGVFPEKLLPLLLNAVWFSEQTKDYKERRRLLLEQFGSLQPADVFTANPELSDLESMLGTHSVDEFSRICTERRKRYKDSLSALAKSCFNCEHFLYCGDGDHVCDLETSAGAIVQPLIDEWDPTEHFFYCGGKKWRCGYAD